MAGLKAGVRHHLFDFTEERLVPKLQARDVDRDPQVGANRRQLLPRLQLPARLAQNPQAERQDEARLLGDGDEIEWRHHAEDRVLPAGERFEADDRVTVERDDGLIEHLELVAIECAREIGFQS